MNAEQLELQQRRVGWLDARSHDAREQSLALALQASLERIRLRSALLAVGAWR